MRVPVFTAEVQMLHGLHKTLDNAVISGIISFLQLALWKALIQLELG